MGTYCRDNLYSFMIAVYKQVVLVEIGIGIHRKKVWITQGYPSSLSGDPRKELPQITKGYQGSRDGCQRSGDFTDEMPSFHAWMV
jgi:hypothetical protein